MHTCAELTNSDFAEINIPSTLQTIMECVSKEAFYKELETYKQNQKRNSSQITLFIEDEFYDSAKEFLKSQAENAVSDSNTNHDTTKLTKWQATTLNRKKWSYHQGKILTTEQKVVVPKSQLYDVLTLAHQRTAHRGRQITSKWINENYSEVNVRVVNLFVSLCQIHQEQKTITSHVKMVTKPLQSPEFLSLIEIDLMDFRNTPCDCKNVHTWAMNIIDHHTKFVTVVPLQQKTADEVLKSLREYCYTYGFPKKIITDNGGEFQNKKLKMFCKDNGIELSHGAPRTPTTQGLTERSNLSWKQDMRSLIVSTADKNIKKWCQYTREASYTRNISYHRAIKVSPYEAVYGIKPHREKLNEQSKESQSEQEENNLEESNEKSSQPQQDEDQPRKRQKIIENQTKYNAAMVNQTKRKQEKKQPKFKVADMVAVKIDKVDKTSPLHPNMLLGKITSIEESGFVQIVTQYGKINTLISPSRLYPCTATTVQLNYSTEISFTAACKKASGFS